MTRRQRTFLFFTFFLLFVISTPLLLLYYAGYRFDLQKRTVTQTGAIYVKAVPRNASVLFESKLFKKTDWLFGTVLIDNLLPKSYRITIEKDGYISWKKTLAVEKKEVTEIKNILLVPQNFQTKSLVDQVQNFWISPNQSLILLEKNALGKGTWLALWDTQERQEHLIWGTLSSAITSVSWRADSAAVLIQTKDKSGFSYILYEISTDAKKLKFFGKDIRKVEFASSSDSNILLEKPSSEEESSLLMGNYASQTLSKPFATHVVNFTIFGDTLFWIDMEGILWKKEILSSNPPFALSSPEPLLQKNKVSLIATGQEIFLQQESSLRLFNKESRLFETIANDIDKLVPSPDGKKVALQNENSIQLFFLEEDLDQPKHHKGEMIYLIPSKNSLQEPVWITSHYLLFSTEKTLKIAEIDTRDKVNVANLNIASSKFSWNDKEKSLFFLRENTLFLSEKLF